MPNIKAIKKPTFLIFNAKKTFNYLWLVFIKLLILQLFDFESDIQIETDALSYAIGGMLSKFNLDSNVLSNKFDFS